MDLREAQKVAGAIDRAVRVFRDLKEAADALVAADEDAARLTKQGEAAQKNLAELRSLREAASREADDCKAKAAKSRGVLSSVNQALVKREKEVEARLEELDKKEANAEKTYAMRRAKAEKDLAAAKEKLAELKEEEQRLRQVIRQFQKTVGG